MKSAFEIIHSELEERVRIQLTLSEDYLIFCSHVSGDQNEANETILMILKDDDSKVDIYRIGKRMDDIQESDLSELNVVNWSKNCQLSDKEGLSLINLLYS